MGLWRRYLRWRQRNVVSIECDDTGFVVIARGEPVAMRWDVIDRVTAYKRDLYTVDLLCLLVQSADQAVETDEQMRGFGEFDTLLHDHLAIPPQWKLAVLFPAFAPNATAIFERQDAAT